MNVSDHCILLLAVMQGTIRKWVDRDRANGFLLPCSSKKEQTMKRFTLILSVVLLGVAHHSVAQQKVDIKGITSNVKMEEVIYGHLADLNGKFKFRVSELSFEPGAHLGAHHHAGPGIRYVVSGRLTFVQAGKETIYQAGDFFYESGNVVHTAHNKSKQPLRVVFFEILPAQWASPSVIPPRSF